MGEVRKYAFPPPFSEFRAQLAVQRQRLQACGERVCIVFRENDPGVAEDSGNLTAVGSDDGHAAGHRLDKYPAKLFLPILHGSTGHDQHVDAVVESWHVGRGDSAQKAHMAFDPKIMRLRFQCRTLLTGAG